MPKRKPSRVPFLFGIFVLSLNKLFFAVHRSLSGLSFQSLKWHDSEPWALKEKKNHETFSVIISSIKFPTPFPPSSSWDPYNLCVSWFAVVP